MKRTNKVRLTESQLHQIIKESVKKVLNEIYDSDYNGFHLGNSAGLATRASQSLKAAIDPKYKERKIRQAKLFGDEGRKTALNKNLNDPENTHDTMSDYNAGFDWGLKGKKLGTHDYFEDLDDEYLGVKQHNDAPRQQVNKWSKDDYKQNYKDRDNERLYNNIESEFNQNYPK